MFSRVAQRFKSTIHRVYNTRSRERYSSPFFVEPALDTVGVCVCVCGVGWGGQFTHDWCLFVLGVDVAAFGSFAQTEHKAFFFPQNAPAAPRALRHRSGRSEGCTSSCVVNCWLHGAALDEQARLAVWQPGCSLLLISQGRVTCHKAEDTEAQRCHQ